MAEVSQYVRVSLVLRGISCELSTG